MKITYETTVENALAFNHYHYKHSPKAKKRYAQSRWGVALLMFAVFAVNTSNFPELSSLVPGAIAAVIFLLLYPVLHGYILKKNVQKAAKDGTYKAALGPHELEVVEDGLICKTPYSETKLAWALIDHIDSTPDQTYFYVGPAQAFFIPHHGITSGDFRGFMTQIGEHYNPNRALNGKTITL